jgi:dCMP deaminase
MSDSSTGPKTTDLGNLLKPTSPPRSELPEPVIDPNLIPLPDSRPSRDAVFMEIARVLRTRSSCRRGKVGVVITRDNRIVASGYNGAPPSAPHCFELGCAVLEDHHVLGCQRAIHAEVNAIAFAARAGVSTADSTMYCTAGACLKCAQQVISAGVIRFVYGNPYRLPEGVSLLIEQGIEVVRYDPFTPAHRQQFDV